MLESGNEAKEIATEIIEIETERDTETGRTGIERD